jgi:2-polyprenyl-6-methoxyphenol hydroxylase-like FAD-dependent oxidoreductase
MASFEVKSTVHVIGAGLAGLAAAVRLADGPRNIVLHDSARQAEGAAVHIMIPPSE